MVSKLTMEGIFEGKDSKLSDIVPSDRGEDVEARLRGLMPSLRSTHVC